MPETSLLAIGLAFLVPLGYALIAVGGLPEERARHAALSTLAALGLGALGYIGTGFALQFGGVGLAHSQPGLEELVWEWSALGATWGTGWGMAGLVGWGLTGPAATAAAYRLALANLPWVVTATLIPLISLRGRIPAWAAGLIGLLVGAAIYPLAGNWIWNPGWLANLGANLGLGHGLVDPGAAGLVHLLGASAAAAGILVFLPRKPRPPRDEPVPLPPVHLPLLAVLGAAMLLAGNLAWTLANPLLETTSLDPALIMLNGVLAAAAGALLPLLYTWFVAGRTDPLMAARGLAAGIIAISAAAPFVPAWASLAIGSAAGLMATLSIFVVDNVLRWDDPTAALGVHGLGGALGLLAVGIFADGRFGVGWNGVGAASYLGIARQGVAGLLAAPGFQPDWPGQMQAQAIGAAALALFGFFAAWLALAPLATALHLLSRRPVSESPEYPQQVPEPGAPSLSPEPQPPSFEGQATSGESLSLEAATGSDGEINAMATA